MSERRAPPMRSYQNAALVGAVRDHQHGALALRARGLDEPEGSRAIVGVQTCGRLIEDRERGSLKIVAVPSG